MSHRRKRKKPTPEIRSIPSAYQGGYTGQFALPTLSGATITEQTALSITAVWNAVNIYANTIASLDLYVAERSDRGGRKPAYDHPNYDLVHSRPNRIATSFRFRQRMVCDYQVQGNHYSEIEFKSKGVVSALHRLDPNNVNPYIGDDGELYYRLEREHIDLPSWKVLHIAGLSCHDGLRGYSPIHLMRETLGLALVQESHQAAVMGNSAMPAGYLKTPATMKDDVQSRLRDSWAKIHQGPDRAGQIGILSGGVEWVQTQFSPADAELLLSRNFSISEIARLFNLPQHMLGQLDHATFSNIEEQNIQFYQLSLRPHLENIEQELNLKLFQPDERKRFFVQHDERSLLRGNMAATSAYHVAMFGIGVLSPNEVRLESGFNPIEDENADKHFIPVNNLSPLEDIPKVAPPQAGDPAIDDSPVAQVVPDEATEIQDTALNGAQIESLIELVGDVAGGILPSAAAKGVIAAAFPTLSADKIDSILGPLVGFKPSAPAGDDPIPQPQEAQDALRSLVEHEVARLVRRECQSLRRASRKQGFSESLEGFYSDHARLVAESMAPSLRAYASLSGASCDPVQIADQMAAESRDRIRGLVVCVPPDELPDAVERVCVEWESSRASSVVASLEVVK